jgi:PAS domain S-box-containing protein
MTVANLLAVSRLTDALSRAITLDDIYAASLDALHRSLGVGRAAVLLFDERGAMSFVAWRGISDNYRRAVDGHSPWHAETTDAEPITVPDVMREPSLARLGKVFESEHIRSLAFVPLNYRDHVIGKFMLYYDEPHEFTSAEVDLARTIAGQIAFGVARVRAEQDLEGERRRLADIIANVPGVVWETTGEGPDLHLTFMSQQIQELLGYGIEEFNSPDFRESVVVAREEQAGSGRPNIRHVRFRTNDGRKIWAEVRSSSKRDGDRIVTRGVTMDITARKELDARNRFLNEASQILGSSLDYASTLGQIADLVVQKLADWCAVEVIHPDQSRRIAAAGREDTAVQPVEVPLRGGGRQVGTILIARNDPQHRFDPEEQELIAELARRIGYAVENALLYREARDANRAKDEFLATLSHELRTPMTATLGWASILRLRDLPLDSQKLAIETIERSTRAQARLIDDILDVSRIVTGKFELNFGAADLRTIVRNAIEAIRPSLDAKGLRLALEIDNAVGSVKGDAVRLQQVIWNLLSNAVKFTGRGGAITVKVARLGSEAWKISVSDTGIGIPAAFLPFVFDRFRQFESSSTRAHGGLGLGLAIVKSIVEMHGGSVTARSDGEGKGATFSVMLPNVAGSTAQPARNPDASSARLDGVTVLIVEDDADTRVMLTSALQEYGASVVSAQSVPIALDVAEIIRPHVLVSDIGMPGEDGYTLMKKILSGEAEQLRDVPAIALTAYTRPEDRDRVLSSGFTYHLAKPVDPLLVVRTVEQAARERS